MADTTRMSWMRRETERRLAAQMALGRQEFAARLRRLREQHDPPMTQEKAAAFLDVPARTYVRWENMEVDASLSSRERVAKGYGIDPQELIADDESDVRATLADFTRLELKVDRALNILEALAGAPEHELEDAVAAVSAAIAAQAPPTDAQPPAAPDKPKRAPASNRRRPARAAGNR